MFTASSARIILAAGMALAGSAQAMTTAPVGNGSDYPAYAQTQIHLTRAQVQAEFVQARQSGMLLLKGDEFQVHAQSQSMPLSRAEVIQAASQARMAGTLPQGDGFGE